MVGECVDQGLVRVARTRMDDETGGLIDDGEVIIFVKNGQRDRLGPDRGLRGRVVLPEDLIAHPEFIPGFDDRIVDGDFSGIEEFSDLGTGKGGVFLLGQEHIKAEAGVFGADGKTELGSAGTQNEGKRLPDGGFDIAAIGEDDIDEGLLQHVGVGEDIFFTILAHIGEGFVPDAVDFLEEIVVLDSSGNFALDIGVDGEVGSNDASASGSFFRIGNLRHLKTLTGLEGELSP